MQFVELAVVRCIGTDFTFESLLDLSDHHLKRLYKEVIHLLAEEEIQAQAQVAYLRLGG